MNNVDADEQENRFNSAMDLINERDALRKKIDAVRAWADENLNDPGIYVMDYGESYASAADDVLAILDADEQEDTK